MIQEFSIENTYSIKNRQTISFESARDDMDEIYYCAAPAEKKLLKLAAIYGPNASGKTNIIRAFSFYMRFILSSFTSLAPNEGTGFISFLFDDETPKKEGTFNLVFYINEVKYDYTLSLDSRYVHREVLTYSPKSQRRLLFERKFVEINKKTKKPEYDWNWGESLTGDKKRIADSTRGNTTFINTAAQFAHQELGKVYDWLSSIFMPLITPSAKWMFNYTIRNIERNNAVKDRIINFLTHSDIGNIKDIVIEKREVPEFVSQMLSDNVKFELNNKRNSFMMKEIMLSHDYGKGYKLPLQQESNGTRRFFELAGPLFDLIDSPKILCIDELESSLHQELAEFFLKTFLENSSCSQMLFTTHNLDLMDSGFLTDDGVWFAEKDEHGGSMYNSITDYTGVRKEVSRKKLYRAGKFGALPITTDFSGE